MIVFYRFQMVFRWMKTILILMDQDENDDDDDD